MTNSNQKARFQTKIAMLEENNLVLRNKCEEYLGEIIRLRKALDVAKDTIIHADWFFDGDYNVDAKTMHNEIKCAITVIEQKDK